MLHLKMARSAKKMVVCIVVLVAAASFAGCGASESHLVGVWELLTVEGYEGYRGFELNPSGSGYVTRRVPLGDSYHYLTYAISWEASASYLMIQSQYAYYPRVLNIEYTDGGVKVVDCSSHGGFVGGVFERIR